MELLWKSGQVIPTSQMQRSISDPPPSFPGSGSREGNAPLPLPQPQPHNLFIQEDEMASWLHHPNRQGDFFSGVASAPATTHQQISVSLAPQPPSPYAPYGQINYMNFSTLRGNILTGGRVEAGPPLMRESTQAFPAAGSYLTPATAIGGVSSTFAVPGRGRKDKEVAIQTFCEIAGTSSSCPETEPVQIQPLMEMETADERKRKEIEETISAIQGTEESRGSTSRKRSRVAEMHNLSEKKRREKINERMKTLQELVPRCNKNDKASMLDDVIHYVKSLQMQVQMLSMGYGLMPPMLYDANAQWFIPNMAMNRPPFPREAYTAGPRSSYPSVQADSNPVSNQPQFPVYMNPYSQFVGLHQMQQPPPLQTQTTSQQSFSQASCSKGHEDQDNQPTG